MTMTKSRISGFGKLISLSGLLKNGFFRVRLAYLLVPQVYNSALRLFASGFVSLTVELYRSKAVYPSKSLREVSTSERCKKSNLYWIKKKKYRKTVSTHAAGILAQYNARCNAVQRLSKSIRLGSTLGCFKRALTYSMLSSELLARCKAVRPRLSRALTSTETNPAERVHDFEPPDGDDGATVDTRRSMLASSRRWKS